MARGVGPSRHTENEGRAFAVQACCSGKSVARQRFLLARSAPLIGPLAARVNSASRRVPPVDVLSNVTTMCCPSGVVTEDSCTTCDGRNGERGPPSSGVMLLINGHGARTVLREWWDVASWRPRWNRAFAWEQSALWELWRRKPDFGRRLRVMHDESVMRPVFGCKDRTGVVRRLAVYTSSRSLPGLSTGAVLRWKNPRFHYFMDGSSGARIQATSSCCRRFASPSALPTCSPVAESARSSCSTAR